jgi:hypothetical protein
VKGAGSSPAPQVAVGLLGQPAETGRRGSENLLQRQQGRTYSEPKRRLQMPAQPLAHAAPPSRETSRPQPHCAGSQYAYFLLPMHLLTVPQRRSCRVVPDSVLWMSTLPGTMVALS